MTDVSLKAVGECCDVLESFSLGMCPLLTTGAIQEVCVCVARPRALLLLKRFTSSPLWTQVAVYVFCLEGNYRDFKIFSWWGLEQQGATVTRPVDLTRSV